MSSTCYVAVKILPSLASEFQAMAAAPAARALQNYIEERSFSFFAKSRDVTSHKATPLFSGSEGFTFYSVTYCQCQRHLAPQPKVCTITPPFVGFIINFVDLANTIRPTSPAYAARWAMYCWIMSDPNSVSIVVEKIIFKNILDPIIWSIIPIHSHQFRTSPPTYHPFYRPIPLYPSPINSPFFPTPRPCWRPRPWFQWAPCPRELRCPQRWAHRLRRSPSKGHVWTNGIVRDVRGWG